MTYVAISQSAKGFGARPLVVIHVVEPRGPVNLTGAIKHSVMHAEILDLLEALGSSDMQWPEWTPTRLRRWGMGERFTVCADM